MTWTNTQVKQFLNAIAATMLENRDYLIDLDSVVGDGDLGLTMSDGFAAAAKAADESADPDLGKLLYACGKAMSAAVPSSMGTLMSAGLMGAGKALKGKTEAGHAEIAACMRGWYDGVQKLGKANPGEKTFLDGFLPAVTVFEADAEEADFSAISAKAYAASQEGANSTVGMLAVHGRAAIRGEASRKLLDPGAVVAGLIVKSLLTLS